MTQSHWVLQASSSWSRSAPWALSLPLRLFRHCKAPSLTFALVVDGAAHGHREKAEGIESSPKEEGCDSPLLRRFCVWVVERKRLVKGTLGKKCAQAQGGTEGREPQGRTLNFQEGWGFQPRRHSFQAGASPVSTTSRVPFPVPTPRPSTSTLHT